MESTRVADLVADALEGHNKRASSWVAPIQDWVHDRGGAVTEAVTFGAIGYGSTLAGQSAGAAALVAGAGTVAAVAATFGIAALVSTVLCGGTWKALQVYRRSQNAKKANAALGSAEQVKQTLVPLMQTTFRYYRAAEYRRRIVQLDEYRFYQGGSRRTKTPKVYVDDFDHDGYLQEFRRYGQPLHDAVGELIKTAIHSRQQYVTCLKQLLDATDRQVLSRGHKNCKPKECYFDQAINPLHRKAERKANLRAQVEARIVARKKAKGKAILRKQVEERRVARKEANKPYDEDAPLRVAYREKQKAREAEKAKFRSEQTRERIRSISDEPHIDFQDEFGVWAAETFLIPNAAGLAAGLAGLAVSNNVLITDASGLAAGLAVSANTANSGNSPEETPSIAQKVGQQITRSLPTGNPAQAVTKAFESAAVTAGVSQGVKILGREAVRSYYNRALRKQVLNQFGEGVRLTLNKVLDRAEIEANQEVNKDLVEFTGNMRRAEAYARRVAEKVSHYIGKIDRIDREFQAIRAKLQQTDRPEQSPFKSCKESQHDLKSCFYAIENCEKYLAHALYMQSFLRTLAYDIKRCTDGVDELLIRDLGP